MLTHILSRKKYKLIFKLSCLAGILILALALRLYHLDSFSFRYDEASQVLDNRSILHLPALYKFFNAGYTVKNHDYLNLYNHSIVYYWRKVFGESERNLRFSSVIFSLLSIIAVFRLAQKYFSEKSAYIAAILISLSAFHIYYAQELRPYAATGLFSLLAVYCFLGYLNNRKNSYIYLYAILSIINIYCPFLIYAVPALIIYVEF